MNVGQFVRIDAREGYLAKVRTLEWSEDYTFIFGMKHSGTTGENAHYHLVIATKVNPQAFRVRMKKMFDQGKGNGHMSIKPWDGSDDACSYMFHEPDAEVVIKKGVSDAQLVQFIDRNKHVQAEVKEAKEKASWTIEEEAYERLKGLTFSNDYDQELAIMKTIIRVAFDKKKYVPQPWLARSMMQNIRFRLCGGDQEDEEIMISDLARKMLPKDSRQ